MTLKDSAASTEKRMRSRTISAGGSTAAKMFNKAEKSTSDYTEISSIPPLPLYALVAADEDISHGRYSLGWLLGEKVHGKCLKRENI